MVNVGSPHIPSPSPLANVRDLQNVRGYLQVNQTKVLYMQGLSRVVKDSFLLDEHPQSVSHHLLCTRMASSRFPVAVLKTSFSPATRFTSIPIRLMLISRRLDGNTPHG